MPRLFIPAIHLPHGAEVFKTLPYTRAKYRKVLKALSERALLECDGDDRIVLPAAPDDDFLAFLYGLGIGTKNIIVCPGQGGNFAEDVLGDAVALEKIKSLSPDEIRFYIHLEEEARLARELGRDGATTHPSLTRMFNTLYFLIRLEEDLELSAIPRVQARSSRLEGALERMLETEKKVFARGNESCGGSQVFILSNRDDVLAMAHKVARNREITRYFASKFIEGAGSWNFQFFLDGAGGHVFVGASRQLLTDGVIHEGNLGGEPVPPDGTVVSQKIAARISEMGGKGFFGVDVLTDGNKAFPAELNMRENTSTPVLAVQSKIKAPCFMTAKILAPRALTFGKFAETAGAEALLCLKDRRGVLPFNFTASNLTGSLDVAVFGESPEDVRDQFERLNHSY